MQYTLDMLFALAPWYVLALFLALIVFRFEKADMRDRDKGINKDVPKEGDICPKCGKGMLRILFPSSTEIAYPMEESFEEDCRTAGERPFYKRTSCPKCGAVVSEE